MRWSVLVAVGLVALTGAPAVMAQSAPVTRDFAGSVDQVWTGVEVALKRLGWNVDQKDRAAGTIVTDSRGLDFKEFGVYGEGTRHKLRLVVKAAGEGRTNVAVTREVYREER